MLRGAGRYFLASSPLVFFFERQLGSFTTAAISRATKERHERGERNDADGVKALELCLRHVELLYTAAAKAYVPTGLTSAVYEGEGPDQQCIQQCSTEAAAITGR